MKREIAPRLSLKPALLAASAMLFLTGHPGTAAATTLSYFLEARLSI